MAITTSAIKERIAQLKEQQEQAISNANALNGAIQDCEYWLAQLEKEAEPIKEITQ